MIINNRKDLDAAPDAIREHFMTRLAGSINRWEWDGTEWKLVQDDSSIVKFDFTVADFPEPPVPEKPDYNPDEKAVDAEADEVRSERDKLLAAADWTQVADAPVDQSAYAEYRQALRDVPEQAGFPSDVDWPEKP
jgi:hypothetical protein